MVRDRLRTAPARPRTTLGLKRRRHPPASSPDPHPPIPALPSTITCRALSGEGGNLLAHWRCRSRAFREAGVIARDRVICAGLFEYRSEGCAAARTRSAWSPAAPLQRAQNTPGYKEASFPKSWSDMAHGARWVLLSVWHCLGRCCQLLVNVGHFLGRVGHVVVEPPGDNGHERAGEEGRSVVCWDGGLLDGCGAPLDRGPCSFCESVKDGPLGQVDSSAADQCSDLPVVFGDVAEDAEVERRVIARDQVI